MVYSYLTLGQQKLVQKAYDWFYNSSSQIFQISGAAGTGKTTILHAIIERLNLTTSSILPMAYVGCAALNMRLHGLYNAKTIHSALYDRVEDYLYDSNGNIVIDPYFNKPTTIMKFVPRDLYNDYNLIIIDEAGMVPLFMKKDIERHNVKIIAVGDLNQLPPIKDNPAYLYTGEVNYLTEIMRQGKNSTIIDLSQRALKGLPIHTGYYPNNVYVIESDQVTPQMLLASDMVICGKNATRDNINKYVRKSVLGIHSPIPTFGEPVMCVQNNWDVESNGINLVNGLIGSVTNNPDVSTYYNGKTFKLDFNPYIGDAPFYNIDVNYEYMTSDFQKRKMLKDSKFGSEGNKFEFAYAATCHKCQGMSLGNVLYFEEFLNKDIQNNLNYTAATRARNQLIYVKHKRKYF